MFLMGWVVLDITSKMYSMCWLVSLSSRSRMALVVCGCLPTYWVCRGQQYISTMLSNNSSSLSGSYRWARVSISSRSRNSSRTCASIWSKSADSLVCPDRLVLCFLVFCLLVFCCNGVQREHNKKLNNGLPILHKVPPKRDYGRYFCIMAEKGGTSHGGLTEKLSPFFHAKKQEVNAYGR